MTGHLGNSWEIAIRDICSICSRSLESVTAGGCHEKPSRSRGGEGTLSVCISRGWSGVALSRGHRVVQGVRWMAGIDEARSQTRLGREAGMV